MGDIRELLDVGEDFLDEIVVDAPLTPWREWENKGSYHEDYEVLAYLGSIQVGRLVISRTVSTTRTHLSDFFWDLNTGIAISKPYVEWQSTEELFRGNGINGRVIFLTNEAYRGKLGTPLYSGTHFLQSAEGRAQRVWQKLTEQGLAEYVPHTPTFHRGSLKKEYEQVDRWRML